MGCQEIRQQLAVYRELSAAEQDWLRGHTATCSDCRATLAAYRLQDQLLSGLPVLTPSPALVEAVHARTVGHRRATQPFSWQRAMAALSLLLFLSVAWGTVSKASAALPGDVLYPIKRGAEQVRLALTFDPAARDQYQQHLAETRQEEVHAVITLERVARVEFQGELMAIHADNWQVGQFEVTVGPQAWDGAPPPTGTALKVEAQATGGRLEAARVRLLQPAVPTPGPQASPAGQLSPSRTPTARQHPGEGTVTPGAPGPESQPSATPGARGPGPQPSTTLGAWSPGPQPSATPSAWGPGSQPSTMPGTSEPGPQPSTTPGAWGPGPQPSATPGTSGPGPQPSVAPGTSEPGSQPSATPGAQGPGPQPSSTPGPGGPGQPPSVTPGPKGH